jgi:hypothetical protein
MEKFLVTLLLITSTLVVSAYTTTRPYDQNWYIRVDRSEAANRDRKYLDPPPAGYVAEPLPKWKRILLRADKQRPQYLHRYQTNVTNREYTDCSYYKYVDCADFTFCRCWQCRDYAYPVTTIDY